MSKCTISFSQHSMAMVRIVMKKNRVIDIPQRSYMVLPRMVKKRKKEKNPEMDYSMSVMAINI